MMRDVPRLPALVRTFIALDTPLEVKEAILRIQEELRRIRGATVSWVRPEGIHLTLKFLGDVESERIPEVIEAVNSSAQGIGRIVIVTTITGGFPRLAVPKVLWLGLEAGEALDKLQNNLERSLSDLGFLHEEKAFHPHLTVGRVKYLDPNRELPGRFGAFSIPSISWHAEEVKVMMSELRPSGAVYTVLAAIPLGE